MTKSKMVLSSAFELGMVYFKPCDAKELRSGEWLVLEVLKEKGNRTIYHMPKKGTDYKN